MRRCVEWNEGRGRRGRRIGGKEGKERERYHEHAANMKGVSVFGVELEGLVELVEGLVVLTPLAIGLALEGMRGKTSRREVQCEL